jgi:hypothetical protein
LIAHPTLSIPRLFQVAGWTFVVAAANHVLKTGDYGEYLERCRLLVRQKAQRQQGNSLNLLECVHRLILTVDTLLEDWRRAVLDFLGQPEETLVLFWNGNGGDYIIPLDVQRGMVAGAILGRVAGV